MGNQLEPTRAQIVALAKLARGPRNRKDVHAGNKGISFNTYSNFEAGTSWPRSPSLRQIEAMLDWKPGSIDEALASGMEPGHIQLPHMRGEIPFGEPAIPGDDLSDDEVYRLFKSRFMHRDETATMVVPDN